VRVLGWFCEVPQVPVRFQVVLERFWNWRAGVVAPQLGFPLFQVVPGRVSVQVPRAVSVPVKAQDTF